MKGKGTHSMFRRFVSSLLIVGYVASQLAAVPHAHGAGSAAEHAQTALPHFHCHGGTHDHGHAGEHRHHDAGGHSHQRSASAKSNGEDQTPQAEVQIGLTDTTHDSDAVYLPAGSNSVLRGTETQPDLTTAAFVTAHLPVAIEAAPDDGWSALAPASFLSSDGSGLYLALRNLRI